MSIGCALPLHWEVDGEGQSAKFIIVMLPVDFAEGRLQPVPSQPLQRVCPLQQPAKYSRTFQTQFHLEVVSTQLFSNCFSQIMIFNLL